MWGSTPQPPAKIYISNICSSRGVEPRNFPRRKLPLESSRQSRSCITLHVVESRRAKDSNCLRRVSKTCRLRFRFTCRKHEILTAYLLFKRWLRYVSSRSCNNNKVYAQHQTLLREYYFTSGGLCWRAMWGSNPQPPANLYIVKHMQ